MDRGREIEAVRGHAEALYPEYVEKLKTMQPATKETATAETAPAR